MRERTKNCGFTLTAKLLGHAACPRLGVGCAWKIQLPCVSSACCVNVTSLAPVPSHLSIPRKRTLRHEPPPTKGLTRRMGELQAQSAAAAVSGGHGDEGGGSQNGSANGAAGGIAARAVAGQGNLQSIFERSRDQQVVAGGVEEYSALQARLNG